MRPLKLTIEGINSFLSSQTVDFEAAGADNLFCISGSTGSGKTTVLDCIILSLYLNHSERGNLSDYINLRCDAGRIDFIFELDGEVYETRRVISRKAGKNSMLLLKGGAPMAEGEEAFKFLGEKIGLEVKEFTNVVVLQQGEFSRFLKAKKAERVALINKLFDLKRFDGLYGKFNARLKALTALSEACDKSLESFALVSDKTVADNEKTVAEKEKEAVAAEKEAEIFRKAAAETRKKAEDYALFIKLKEEIAAAEKELAVLSEREQKGNEYKNSLSERETALKAREEKRDLLVSRRAEIVQTAESLAQIEKKEAKAANQRAEAEKKALAVAEKEEKLKILRTEYQAAQNEVEKIASDKLIGDSVTAQNAKTAAALGAENCRRDIADAKKADSEAADAKAKLAAAERDKNALEKEWINFNAAHAAIAKNVERCAVFEKSARDNYEIAMKDNALALVMNGLKEGDDCPVCGGKVTRTEAATGVNLDIMKNNVESAEKTRKQSEAELSKSAETLSALTERLSGAVNTVKTLTDECAQKEKLSQKYDVSVLSKRLEVYERLSKAVENSEVLCKKTENAAAELALMSGEAKSALTAVAETEKEIAEEKLKLKTKAGENSAAEKAEIERKLEALNSDRKKLDADKSTCERLLGEIKSKSDSLKGRIASAKEKLKETAPVKEQDAIESETRADEKVKAARILYESLASAREKLNREKEDLGRKKVLIAEKAGYDREAEKFAVLTKLFNKNAFSEFVAAEYIKDFTAVASDKLSDLTMGKYRLIYDEESGEFFVEDFLSGNEKRGVKTLSGGETFLASLALAIAISGELSKNKNYDFFFIDEGFGTLSPDALDMVTNALEKLSRDTLVGVITHRSELIERIPSVIRVEAADADTGSKIIFP